MVGVSALSSFDAVLVPIPDRVEDEVGPGWLVIKHLILLVKICDCEAFTD